MVFSSGLFLFCFLPIVLALYFFAAERYRNVILLLASLFFYAWGEPKNVLLMISSILINFFCGQMIDKSNRRKIYLVVSIIFNLGMLFVFKYLNFTVSIWESITGSTLSITKIGLPIGISFFTFQIMSYIIDVYRGNVKAQRNPINFALYVSLFPQLIAGPIVRYIDVDKQIRTRKCSCEKAYEGFKRFAIGFSKKILIADQLSKLVEITFSNTYPSIFGYWVGIIAYSLQIYYDFSGYSDMAIGLGKIFGFDFLENFNYPYISKSIKEFWRRWHISLSTWFKDYLYIPLGGNRKGKIRTYINLMIVFLSTGLWHGASWNFIIWGVYYGLFLIIERIGFGKILQKWPKSLQHLYTIIIVMIGWVFFRADSLNDALIYIKGMFMLHGKDWNNFQFIMNGQYWLSIFTGVIFAIPHKKLIFKVIKIHTKEWINDILIIGIFMLAICYMVGSGYSPFLYFRF